ncbi:uncharacterized protein TrAtP1_003347 [Trichoderma atroviride]|uniref:uncharacterized protein n=1 Tax=Hypocrea atroviridis TaxID=63577 RepID=UPI003316C5C2|nr:hypothetical protein TrAtP1_003347 [Trichoderma atroviride]
MVQVSVDAAALRFVIPGPNHHSDWLSTLLVQQRRLIANYNAGFVAVPWRFL